MGDLLILAAGAYTRPRMHLGSCFGGDGCAVDKSEEQQNRGKLLEALKRDNLTKLW